MAVNAREALRQGRKWSGGTMVGRKWSEGGLWQGRKWSGALSAGAEVVRRPSSRAGRCQEVLLNGRKCSEALWQGRKWSGVHLVGP